ncbi:hypothetical protein ABT299_50595 [Spirillospora sp. NPDC000708]
MTLIPSLRLVRLHLASRRAVPALSAICCVGCVPLLPIPRPSGPLGVVLPLAVAAGAAAVVGTSTASPIGEAERVTGRHLPALRTGTAVLLLAAATAILAAAAAHRAPAGGSLTLLRALAGLAGITLLTAAFLSPHRCWAPPLAYTILCGRALERSWTSLWFWPIRAPTTRPPRASPPCFSYAGWRPPRSALHLSDPTRNTARERCSSMPTTPASMRCRPDPRFTVTARLPAGKATETVSKATQRSIPQK